MEAIRKIMQAPQDSITVQLPPSFRRRMLEVLVMPLDDDTATNAAGSGSGWPADFFTRIAGGWSGPALERAPQGKFEIRKALD